MFWCLHLDAFCRFCEDDAERDMRSREVVCARVAEGNDAGEDLKKNKKRIHF